MRFGVSVGRRGRVFCFFLVLVLFRVQAIDLYVSTQGSDAGPGTSAQPFGSITHAYSLAGPGDRILVMPGVYTDYTSGWGLHLGANGTAGNPIVLKSQVKGAAVIDGQNASDRNQGIYLDGSYNIVDGFEIRNNPNGGISIWGDNNQILNCEIHHNGNPASSSTNGKDGIYSDSPTSGNVYSANYIHDNGRAGSNFDHGLYLCGKNELVINNVLIGNAANGLQVAGYTTVSNMKVYNNVMAWNGTSGIILWQALSGVDIKNNILYQNGHYGLASYDAHGTGVVLDHNLAFGNAYGDWNFAGGGSDYSYSQGTIISAAPALLNVNLGGFDAHLVAGSPAINAGLNLSSVFTTDKDGTARPASGAWDLGPYCHPPSVSSLVTLSSPANNATVSGSSVPIAASASGLIGTFTMQFQADGASLGSSVLLSPYQVSWDTTSVANGVHSLNAVATDLLGNQTVASPVSVVVNNPTVAVKPVIAWTKPADILYGTALSGTQLNATADVPGIMVYSPPAGTVLNAGADQTLSVTFTPTDTTKYETASASLNLSVASAPLMVRANDASRAYGSANPQFTATYSGFVNGDTAAVVSGTPFLISSATITDPPGSYAIVPAAGSLSAANYIFTSFVPGTLTVTQISDITLGPPLRVGQELLFSVQSVAGTQYVLEYKNSLAETNWTRGQANVGDGNTITFTSDIGTNPMGFYRIHVQ